MCNSRFRAVLGVLLSAALLSGAVATAKDFDPGDLRVCNATRCVPITNRSVLAALGEFYYGSSRLSVAPAPRMGAPSFELRFRNGYGTGVVASARLDRFLSYGVNLGHFREGKWYRVPAAAARELRRLAAPLKPIPLTPSSVARSR